jgi:hypothetical protein
MAYIGVELPRCVEVVVVRSQASLLQLLGLVEGQHTQSATHFQAHTIHLHIYVR